MKAWLIDPETQRIREVDFDGTEAHMQVLLGPCDCIYELERQTFAGDPLGDYETLYIGDDYPSIDNEPSYNFLLDVYPISSRALILGIAEDGGDTDTRIPIDELARRISWTRGRAASAWARIALSVTSPISNAVRTSRKPLVVVVPSVS